MESDNGIKRRKTHGEFDFDELLSLEDEFYQEGFKEGQEESTRQQYNEGKEYGYQTGFQRFLAVGYLRGLSKYWTGHVDDYNIKSLSNHLTQFNDILDTITASNDDESVANYEKNLTKARNKARVIAGLCKEQWKVSKLDEMVKQVGGQMQVSENVDDMW